MFIMKYYVKHGGFADTNKRHVQACSNKKGSSRTPFLWKLTTWSQINLYLFTLADMRNHLPTFLSHVIYVLWCLRMLKKWVRRQSWSQKSFWTYDLCVLSWKCSCSWNGYCRYISVHKKGICYTRHIFGGLIWRGRNLKSLASYRM